MHQFESCIQLCSSDSPDDLFDHDFKILPAAFFRKKSFLVPDSELTGSHASSLQAYSSKLSKVILPSLNL